MHYYTLKEIDYLREITLGRSNKEITQMFNEKFNINQSEKAISAIRKKHKISTGLDGRFEKGQSPWNKGKKGISLGGIETQFKKGDQPRNWVPLGSERVTKDGYIQIKIQEGKFQHNWKGKHILIWEEHNGAFPPKHAIIFGDGNKRNFELNNLILVSRRELLTLNKNNLIQKDTELTKVAVNIAKLQIQVQEARKR